MTEAPSPHRGARPVDRTRHEPLWVQARDDIRRRLEAGEFTDVFPGELALTEQYAVSRHTIREALRQLRADGLVTATRGQASRPGGTEAIEQPLGALYSLFASVEAAGKSQRSIVRCLDVRADGVVATRLGLEESTPLVYLERLRLADEDPLAVDRAWLPESIAGPVLHADFGRTALYDQLRERCGLQLTGGSERIRAVVPTRAEQRLLAIDESVAVFVIDRLGCAAGRAVEWRQTLVRADRFTMTAEFAAATGYRLGVSATAALPRGIR